MHRARGGSKMRRWVPALVRRAQGASGALAGGEGAPGEGGGSAGGVVVAVAVVTEVAEVAVVAVVVTGDASLALAATVADAAGFALPSTLRSRSSPRAWHR